MRALLVALLLASCDDGNSSSPPSNGQWHIGPVINWEPGE